MNRPKRKRPSGWEDIGDILTLKALLTFKSGQVLTFQRPGEQARHYRIMRIAPKAAPYRCWVRRIERYYTPEEAARYVSTESTGK